MSRALALLLALCALLLPSIARAHARVDVRVPGRASGAVEASARSRVGSPEFLQRDPEGFVDSVNQYAAMANDPVNKRDPTGRAVYVDDLADTDLKHLLRELAVFTGFTFTVSAEGLLGIDDTVPLDGGSDEARKLVRELTKSKKVATLHSASRLGWTFGTPIAFGVTVPFGGYSDVYVDSSDLYQIPLSADSPTVLSAGLGFVVLHELLHAIGGALYDDPSGNAQLREPGRIEARLNKIRGELNLPKKLIYGAVIGPDGDPATCNFAFDDGKGGVYYLPFHCENVGLPERAPERVPQVRRGKDG